MRNRGAEQAAVMAAVERLLGPVLGTLQAQHLFSYGKTVDTTITTLNLADGTPRKTCQIYLNGGDVPFTVTLPRDTASIVAGEWWLVAKVNGSDDDLVAMVAL